MTYSIIAVDAATGEIGIAAQTCWPAVGASVPWVEAGVGAVATQAFTNRDLGPAGLALLREGMAPDEAITRLLATDPGAAMRQVAIVDASGRSAATTGARCVAEAGHVCAPGISAQGNMLEHRGTWDAMRDAFDATDGDLADRLLAALRAGEAAGGDMRGRRSATLVVAPGAPRAASSPGGEGGMDSVQPWARRFDLRIDSSASPIDDLATGLRLARAYELLAQARAVLAGDDAAGAARLMDIASELAPEDPQLGLWHTLVLEAAGRSDPTALLRVFAAEPRLAEFGRRYARAGHGGSLRQLLEAL
ncbi:MAG: DUF1028 domain-containing protein [Chloroflexi bacterium]|nr:DUF1028 domain-containing protein [Chloroflexota bacterium]